MGSGSGPRRAASILVAAVALLAVGAGGAAGLPSSAEGDGQRDRRAATFLAIGHGWGHGVGLSQYGAYGMALEGTSYRRILSHYYRRTDLDRGDPRDVRVLLSSGLSSVRFDGADAACGKNLKPARSYSFELGGRGVILRGPTGRRIAGCGKSGRASGPRYVTVAGVGAYRDQIVARDAGGSINLVNDISLEDYLKGVVPNEVPASWPEDALRAQAVVARSYALATTVGGEGFDLYDDTRSQVYGGVVTENPATNAAIRATRREVLRHKGEIATTFYFSTSGGQTESVEFGFPGAPPAGYLKSVADPADHHSPYHDWRVRFSRAEIESMLAGLFSGRLRRIEILKRGDSPRIVKARVVGSDGSTIVSGPTLQAELGLRSTWFRIKKVR